MKKLQLLLVALALVSFTAFYSCGNAQEKATETVEEVVEEIVEEPGFRAIKAVRNGRIYLIDEYLVSRPTPRLLQGIKTIHQLLYQG